VFFGTFIPIVAVNISVDTSNLAVAVFFSADVMVFTDNWGLSNTILRIAANFNTFRSLFFFEFIDVDTSGFRIAGVIGTFIVVITDNRRIDTTEIFITVPIETSVISGTFIRDISIDTTFLRVTGTFLTCVTIFADNIFIEKTSLRRNTGVSSASIVVITSYRFVFTRIIGRSIRITRISGTFIIIVTVNFFSDTSLVWATVNRLTRIFCFTLVRFIVASGIDVT
jgi:hypothetical protein